MGLRKRVQKWGNSLVIVLTKADIDVYGIVEGDILEFQDMLKERVIKIKDKKK